MPKSVTLQQLQQDSLLRADMVNSDFVGSPELTRYINQGITELYEQEQLSGGDYYLKQWNPSTVNGQDTYALPADFFALRGVDINLGGQQLFPANRLNWQDRNMYKLTGTGWYGGPPGLN